MTDPSEAGKWMPSDLVAFDGIVRERLLPQLRIGVTDALLAIQATDYTPAHRRAIAAALLCQLIDAFLATTAEAMVADYGEDIDVEAVHAQVINRFIPSLCAWIGVGCEPIDMRDG